MNISVKHTLIIVLANYFNHTPAAGDTAFFGGTSGIAPMNYLPIFYQDIQFATAHVDDAPTITLSDKAMTQMMISFHKASETLFGISETEP
jgi:hypothetical protein